MSARPLTSGDETTAAVDIDGDGEAEVVRMNRYGPCRELTSWRLSVDGAERDLSESFGFVGPTLPTVMGGVDLDGDGAEEIWSHTGWDAMSARFGLFTYRDGILDYIRFENGQPAEWSVADHPKYPRGVACQPTDGGGSTVVSYSTDRNKPGGEPMEVSVRTYLLDGPVLRLDSALTVPDNDSTKVYWKLTCGTVGHPG